MPDFPIVIEDYDGDTVAIDLTSSGNVSITTPGPGVYLGADQREAFAQAYIAACHEADRQAAAPGNTSATPDGGHARTFPVQARYAYPGNGLLFDQQTAAEHLVPGQVYTVQRMEVGGSRTLLFLLGHPETGFNSVLFAPAYDGGRQAGAVNGG